MRTQDGQSVKKAYLLVFFLLLTSLFYAESPQDLIHPADLSEALFLAFTDCGFQPERQLLSSSSSTSFPFNIVLSFAADETLPFYDEKNILVVSLTQEDAYRYLTSLLSFSYAMLLSPPAAEVQLIITANDKSIMPLSLQTGMPAGVKTATSSLLEKPNIILVTSADYYEATCPSQKKQTEAIRLFAGAGGTIVPQPVFKTMTDVLYDNNINYELYGRLFMLYRFDLLKVSTRMEYLTENDFPTLEVVCLNDEEGDRFFKCLPEYLMRQSQNAVQTTLHDVNYMKFGLKEFSFWISESIFVYILLGFVAIILFSLCMFSFVNQKKYRKAIKDFTKTWYILPMIVLLVGIFLTIGQHFASLFYPDPSTNVVGTLVIKIVSAFVLLSLFSLLRHFIEFPFDQFIYGYLLTIMSFINIFIFSIVSLPFCVIFTIEYLIIYLSRPAKRIWSLIVSTLCMTIPFIPIFIAILEYCDLTKLVPIVTCSVPGNLLASCFLVPFELMWIRILVHFKLFGKIYYYSLSRFILDMSLTAIAAIVLVIGSIISVNMGKKSSTQQSEVIINSVPNVDITLTGSTGEYLDITTYKILITSQRAAIRYNVSLYLPDDKILYSADFPYERLDKNMIVFLLDENPREHLLFTYSTSPDTYCKAIVTSFYKEDDHTISEEKATIAFNGEAIVQ